MIRYQVTRACTIGDTQYKGGEIIPFDAVPEGSWQSVRAMGLLVEVPDDPATPDNATDSQDAPKKRIKT